MKTSHKIGTLVAGAALVGGVALAVPAMAEDSATSTPQAQSQSTDRPTDPMSSTLSKLVKDGTITQTQADKIVATAKAEHQAQRGKTGPMGPGGPMGRGGPADMHGGPGMMGQSMQKVAAAAAKTLGLSESQLQTKLKTQSLGEIADAQKVSRDTLKASLKTAITTEMSTNLDQGLDRIMSMKLGDHMMPGGPSGSDRQAPNNGRSTPTASPTQKAPATSGA